MRISGRADITAALLAPPVVILMWSCLLGGCMTGNALGGHAVADDWSPVVAAPAYPKGQGPRVTVDAAHGNWHTIEGRYRAFAMLLEADGHRVESSRELLSDGWLSSTDILVIANAIKGGEDSEWVLPTPPAFQPEEVLALEAWVRAGGSLLLIADHMPFPGSVADIARSFGIVFYNGYAKKSFDQGGTLVFTREAGTLAEHAVTNGLSDSDRVERIKSYTGQAFRLVAPGEPLLLMPEDWIVLLPQDALLELDAATPFVPARGLLQGALRRHGAGRIAVFGEAAMFTAQAVRRADGEIVHVGLNDPEAADNAQFILNVMHWLADSRAAFCARGGSQITTCD